MSTVITLIIVVMKAQQNPQNEDALTFLRQAAALGPGYRGTRQSATQEQRTELRELMSSKTLDPPAFLDQDHTWIDRKAKLFEAGEFPDKGVTITADTLKGLEASFDLPVPVLIEHSKSPLELGYLTHIEADGDQLFGTVALTKEANDLIDKSGAHALSLGLSHDLEKVVEVSLVKKPRVASARLFTGEFLNQEPDWKAKYEALQVRLATAQLEQLVASGRLVPQQLPFARAILEVNEAITFDGESVPVSQLFSRFLQAGRNHDLFGELAPGAPETKLDGDSRAFYDRYFPDLSLADIVQNSKL